MATVNFLSRRFFGVSSRILGRGKKVNDLFQPGVRYASPVEQKDTYKPPVIKKILAEHAANRVWSKEEVLEANNKHSISTWTAHDVASAGALVVDRAEGVYVYDMNGKRYMDFNSSAMCTNLGQTVPTSIIAAVESQLKTLPYAYPGAFITPIRAKLCKLLAEICPGDIEAFMFPSSGAEANEIAIRIARLKTGRHKILSRYRSYHGATVGTISATGDQRRWAAELGGHGYVKFFDPYPYSFQWGTTVDEICEQNLRYLRELIDMEGPKNVAGILLESVTGTNGVLPPPPRYLQGIRDICDEHGIVMICDEVMAGFGRTGKLFGFMHAPGVIPDVVTFAKGVNGAYVPLGGVGMRKHVADHFRKNNVSIGSTYNSHPVALASAYAAIQHFLEADILGNVAKNEPVMKECLNSLLSKHPSVKQARSIGLFGIIDIQKNARGDFIAKVSDPLPAPMVAFKKSLLENGLFTMMRGHNVFCNPPLVITPDQLREGFAIIDKSLSVLDAHMEK